MDELDLLKEQVINIKQQLQVSNLQLSTKLMDIKSLLEKIEVNTRKND